MVGVEPVRHGKLKKTPELFLILRGAGQYDLFSWRMPVPRLPNGPITRQQVVARGEAPHVVEERPLRVTVRVGEIVKNSAVIDLRADARQQEQLPHLAREAEPRRIGVKVERADTKRIAGRIKLPAGE